MQHHSEILKDIDESVKRWTYAIRGLNEVVTDEKGKELIGEVTSAMRVMYNHLREYVADLEANNMQLNLKLNHDSEIKLEHRLLKQAHFMNMEIDKTGQMLKELIANRKKQ